MDYPQSVQWSETEQMSSENLLVGWFESNTITKINQTTENE